MSLTVKIMLIGALVTTMVVLFIGLLTQQARFDDPEPPDFVEIERSPHPDTHLWEHEAEDGSRHYYTVDRREDDSQS